MRIQAERSGRDGAGLSGTQCWAARKKACAVVNIILLQRKEIPPAPVKGDVPLPGEARLAATPPSNTTNGGAGRQDDPGVGAPEIIRTDAPFSSAVTHKRLSRSEIHGQGR